MARGADAETFRAATNYSGVCIPTKPVIFAIEFAKQLVGLLLELFVSRLKLRQFDATGFEFGLMLLRLLGIREFELQNRLSQSVNFCAAAT